MTKSKKMTNAEIVQELYKINDAFNKWANKSNNNELVISLFIEFLGEKLKIDTLKQDFQKWLIDWKAKQEKENDKTNG